MFSYGFFLVDLDKVVVVYKCMYSSIYAEFIFSFRSFREPCSVSLTVTAVLPGWTAEAHGLGLVALHERVRLVGGTFWTGRHEHTGPDGWSLALRLRDR